MVLRVDGTGVNHPIPDTAVHAELIAAVFLHRALLAEEARGNQMCD